MKKIVFVCTGNTCRSPMAEATFKSLLERWNIREFEVSSVGLSAFSGSFPSDNGIRAMREVGVDIRAHRARVLTQEVIEGTDMFVCMTHGHANILKTFVSDKKIMLLADHDIKDPYGGDIWEYRRTVDDILDKLEDLLLALRALDK